MKKAAIYMRVSTARQEEEQTVQNQYMELKQRVKEDGNLLSPDCIYKDEGWSGSILERPELDRLRTNAHEEKFEILYFYDRGRISRIYVHQEIILEDLRNCGIEIISLHDINGDTSEAKLMGGFMGLFAEYERVKITERMRLGKLRKVKESKKLLGYQPKYGYDYHARIKTGPHARDGYFTINKKQAEVVRQIFEWVASGMSKHEIKRQLFKSDILPPRGMRDQWSGGTLNRMVQDTTYMGDHYYNKSESIPTKNPQKPEQKYRKVTKGSRVIRPKEEWYLVQVPAIVSKSLFDRVQVQLALNKKTNKRNNSKNKYLVSGLIQCSCGKARTGDPVGQGNAYYRCTDRLNKYPLPRTCKEAGLNVTVFDALVWHNIQELLTQPDLLVQQAKRWQKDASPLQDQLQALKAALTSLDEKELRYAAAYGEGDDVMPLRVYQDNMHLLNEKRTNILSEIAAIEDELANKPAIPLEKLVDGMVKLVESLDFTNKKQIIQKLVTKIIATKEEITIWGRIPLLTTGQVGYESINRYRRPSERRQVYPFQRLDQQ